MFILDQTNTIANQYLYELRDKKIQLDRLRFRKNLERLGEIIAYEISKSFFYSPITIETQLGKSTIPLVQKKPILISVMRAAIPFYQGFLNFYDTSDSGFIGAYRVENSDGISEVEIDYMYQAAPNLEGKEIIIIDPMLATGKSFIKTIDNLCLSHGKPSLIHIASVIAAPEGIAYLKNKLDVPYKLWVCSVDEKLNDKSYIIPGLGDAGDLCFGQKL